MEDVPRSSPTPSSTSSMTLSEDQLQKIHAACVKVLPDAKIFLAQLVQKDTTNPPGKNYPEIATIIKTKLEALTYNVKLIETTKHLPPGGHGRRVNVLGTLKTKSSNPQQIKASSGLTRTKLLHFNGHFDVVPIGDRSTWQHDPFGANIVGNVMYGRGTSDMKGGIAAQVYAIEALREAKLVLRGDIGQSCVVDEETTGNENAGAGYLVDQKHIHSENTDAVVITEPLNPDNVCIGHRGAIWGTITFKGRAMQSAMPALGVNALVHAARFIVEAEKNIAPKLKKKTQQDVIPEEARSPSLTFTMLQAGENNNTVPDKATLKFDRRLVTGESLTEAREQIKSLLDRMKTEDKTFCPDYREYYSTDPVRIDPSCDLVTKWKYGVKTVFNRDAGIVCSPGTDDQRFFFRDGDIKQTIVYGPGNIKHVHNADECLNLDDLQKSIEVMAIGAATFLGVD